ncbi:hypothetical protein BC832DRAFT_548637, partial [Gaertneriomyces semiglobifer]
MNIKDAIMVPTTGTATICRHVVLVELVSALDVVALATCITEAIVATDRRLVAWARDRWYHVAFSFVSSVSDASGECRIL